MREEHQLFVSKRSGIVVLWSTSLFDDIVMALAYRETVSWSREQKRTNLASMEGRSVDCTKLS